MLKFCILIATFISICKGQTYKDETKLLGYLFNHGRYDKFVRPVNNRSTILQVDISHLIRAISHVDVVSGEVFTFSYLHMAWLDEQLIWNPQDYGGIYNISLPEGKFWTPELEKLIVSSGNGAHDEHLEAGKASLTYEGKVSISVFKRIGVLCIVDMTYYPFDEHHCFHQFYSTKYTQNELVINILDDKVIGDDFQKNQEWKVFKKQFFVVNTSFYGMSFSYAANLIALVRRPGFILINNFIPAIFLIILRLFVPLVPPDSERLSFSITTYLALVFINISLISDMPRNSIKVIMLSYYLLASNAISTLELMWSIFIVCLSKTSERKIPKCLLNRLRDKEEPSKQEEEKETELPKPTAEPQKHNGWYEVSRYLDKVYFLVSFLVVISLFAILLYMFSKRHENTFTL